MAGDWLKMEIALADKPEVMRVAGALNLDRDLLIGKLFRLWSWFDQHTEDGNARGVTTSLLDSLLGVTGLCDSLKEVGWLDHDDLGIRLPNFSRHNGKTAKNRALTAKRVAEHKKRLGNVVVTLTPLPREEKRREEVNPIVPSGQFLRFWAAWPKHERKASQGKCWAVWLKADFDQQAEAVIAHVEALKSSDGWRKGFVPAPLTYLNQRRWDGAELGEQRHEHGSPGRLAV